MKSLFALSLLALSLSSIAGTVRMVGSADCSSIAPKTSSADAQKAQLTNCAESRAKSDLSKKCEGCGNGWLLEAEIAQRDFKIALTSSGRSMTVSAMAVGRCEF